MSNIKDAFWDELMDQASKSVINKFKNNMDIFNKNSKKCNKCQKDIYFIQGVGRDGAKKWRAYDVETSKEHWKSCGVKPVFTFEDKILTNWKEGRTSIYLVKAIDMSNMTYGLVSLSAKKPYLKHYDIATIDKLSTKMDEAAELLYT